MESLLFGEFLNLNILELDAFGMSLTGDKVKLGPHYQRALSASHSAGLKFCFDTCIFIPPDPQPQHNL